MTVIQANYRFPIPLEGDYDGLIEHTKERVRDDFGRELIRALAERGGIIGPIHEETAEQDDWLWKSGTKTVTYTIYAKFTEMPTPENYRLMGGPADGRIVLTGGALTWRVPFLPPPLTDSLYDLDKSPTVQYAEYEREGDSQVYLFRGVR